jgi:hypothetical protein
VVWADFLDAPRGFALASPKPAGTREDLDALALGSSPATALEAGSGSDEGKVMWKKAKK